MASKLRQQILDARDIKTQRETVPEWGITVEIRGLTGAQLVDCTEKATVKRKNDDGAPTESTDTNALTRLMLLRSLFDPETGEQILEEADAEALWQKSAQVLNRLANIVAALNGTTQADGEAMEKNSDATTSGAGASA